MVSGISSSIQSIPRYVRCPSIQANVHRPVGPILTVKALRSPKIQSSADADGEIALDWIFGERKALTVSIGPTGRCTFAWMLGQRTYLGIDWIDDEIPETIVSALGQLA